MKLEDDDFALFGLPRRQALDVAELERQRLARQAAVHPDRFVAEGAAAQRVAMQWAVRLNEAHRRLKDPLRRGAYLLKLRGGQADEGPGAAVPAALLLRQMAWHEALEAAAAARDAGALQALHAEVAGEELAQQRDLAQALDETDDLDAAAQAVQALRFLKRLEENLRRQREALEDAAA